jgi:putative transposase
MIKMVAGRYTRYVNKNYKRTGTLWEGRFKSSPIEQERYLLSCIRYIEMNPVRAAIVSDPRKYQWSSYQKKAFLNSDPILDLDIYYLELGNSAAERAKAYREWFKASVPKEEWDRIKEGIARSVPIGSEEFTSKLSEKLGRQTNIGLRGRPKKEK